MAKAPPPILLSAMVCERVILDAVSRMPSVICITETISAPKYPARHARLSFFFELTNGHGPTKVVVRLVDVQQNDKILLESEGLVKFKNVRQVVGQTFCFDGFVFPHPGEYRFQIYAQNEPIGERRVVCRQIKLLAGGQNQ